MQPLSDGSRRSTGLFWQKIGTNERDTTDTRRERNAKPRKSTSRSGLHRPALVAACIGIILSSAAAFTVACWESRAARAEFEVTAETQAIVLQNGINEYVSRLSTLRTLFESATRISRVASTRPSAHGFSRDIRGSSALHGHQKSSARSVPNTRQPPLPTAFPATSSSRFRMALWRLRATSIIPSTSDRTEDLPDLRAGLLDRSRAPCRARTRSRRGRDQGVAHEAFRGTERPQRRRDRRLRTGLCQGHVTHYGCGPPAQPRGLLSASSISPSFCNRSATRMRQIRPSASACTRRPLPVPATWRSGMHPDFSSVQRIRASGDLQWWTTLRIGDANWRLLATPAIDGQLIAQHYRALSCWPRNLSSRCFLRFISRLQAGIHCSCHSPTGASRARQDRHPDRTSQPGVSPGATAEDQRLPAGAFDRFFDTDA